MLDDEDVQLVKKVVETLNNKKFYHATSFDKATVKHFLSAVNKVVGTWPLEKMFACLDLARQFLLHPSAAQEMPAFLHYCEQVVKVGWNYQKVQGKLDAASVEFALSFYANLYANIETRKLIVEKISTLIPLEMAKNGNQKQKLILSSIALK